MNDFSVLHDPDYYRRRPATRGEGLKLVESQKTERHQATEVPTVWPSVVERESRRPWRWVATSAGFFALACGGLFAPFAWQLVIGATFAVGAGVVIGRVCR